MKIFTNFSITKIAFICLTVLSLASCRKDRNMGEELAIGPDINFFALTNDNKLNYLNAQGYSNGAALTITGLQTGETVLGIDFRPATGQLYALGSTSRIYTINLNTGAVKQVGTNPFTPAIAGTAVGFDFNPTVDKIRIVTNTGQNLRVDPETGLVVGTDTNLPTTSQVTSVAYTDNRAGATTTTLFDIDALTNKLFKQDPPNLGTLVAVGDLGVDVEDLGGFDISPAGVGLAAMSVGGVSGLYTIDLTSGKATKVGTFQTRVIGIAIPTNAIAYVVNANNEFVIYNPNTDATVTKVINGMQPNEQVLGMDIRPANGQIYVLGSTSRIYTINGTGAAAIATPVGTTPFATLLNGTSFGFDFNPTVDRIRIVSNTGQNLRVDPGTGAIATIDGALNPGTPSVTAAAYTNNFNGATTTELFDIDTQNNTLYKQDANPGTLTAVGPLGITVTAANGFDIGGTSGRAYAMLTVGTATKLYTINLTTGAATAVKDYPTGVKAFTLGLGF